MIKGRLFTLYGMGLKANTWDIARMRRGSIIQHLSKRSRRLHRALRRRRNQPRPKQEVQVPAVSRKQQKFMAICAHNPSKARGKCPSHKVSEEFSHNPGHPIPEFAQAMKHKHKPKYH